MPWRLRLLRLRSGPLEVALGVGQDEDPNPKVGGTNGGRWNAVPFRIVPELGQAPENLGDGLSRDDSLDSVDALSDIVKEAVNVLHEDVSRSNHANETGELRPKPAGVGVAFAPASSRDRRAREPSADEIDSFKLLTSHREYVVEPSDVRPVLGQDAQTERIALDLPATLQTGALQPQVETSDP